MKKSYLIAVLLLVCGVNISLPAAPSSRLSAFGNVRTKSLRMPFYREGKLEFYLRSSSAAMHGKMLNSTRPVIDVVRKGVGAETIARSDSSDLVYTLNARLNEVEEYWKKRSYSECVVVSDSAAVDQNTRIITSESKIFLRSPMMDLNGVGYTVDMRRNVISVNSNVEIVLRNDGSNSLGTPLDTVSDKKGSNKISVTRVFCDELVYNLTLDKMDLIGNVRVYDEAGNITSDELQLVFAGTGSAPGKKKLKPDTLAESGKKLKTAKFTGNFYAERKLEPAEAAKGKQFAKAQNVFYDLLGDSLEMTGGRPHMARGRDWAEAQRIVIRPGKKMISFYERCEFNINREGLPAGTPPDVVTANFADFDYPGNLIRLIGNARLKSESEKSDMTSERIFITLVDDAAKQGKNVKKNTAAKTGKGGMADEFANSSKRVDKIIAEGDVKFSRRNKDAVEKAQAGRITYLASGEKIIFEQKPVLWRNNDMISGGKLTYLMASERLMVADGSNIVISPETAGDSGSLTLGAAGKAKAKTDKSGQKQPVTVVSQESDLNFGGNVIGFAGQVKVRGKDMLLDSDKLDIFLKDAPETAKKVAADKKTAPDAMPGGRKQPVRALAVGNVYMEDKASLLRAGLLDIYFGEQQTPGKTEVEKIIADNNVYVENKQAAGSKGTDKSALLGNAGGSKTTLEARKGVIDVLKDDANFYGNVKVSDSTSLLNCGHLYVLTRRTAKVIPTVESFRARDEFPDQLAIGEGRELVRIEAHDDVRIRRTLANGDVQRVKSDHAHYVVKERVVVMHSDPPRRPQAVADGMGMIGDKVTIDLDAEEVFVDNGDVLTKLDGMEF